MGDLSSRTFGLDYSQVDEITENIKRFADGREAESIINEYLHGEGGELIKNKVHELIPESGRHWKGKRPSAWSTDSLKIIANENLAVGVTTTKSYQYLYFPDDGSNTLHHEGNEHFFFAGAEASSEKVGDDIINRLIERLGK